jgi:branched-chain amino acid transport system substrate-binding protein
LKARVLVAGALAVGVLLAACGDDDDATAGGDSGGAGDNAADTSLEPVRVGVANLEGSAVSLAEIREGVEAGVEYVNAELDGINGRPLELVVCKTDVAPETSVNCANQFVESGVVAVFSAVDIGVDAALPVLEDAGIPIIGLAPGGPDTNEAVGDAFMIVSSSQESVAAAFKVQEQLGINNIVITLPDAPDIRGLSEQVVEPIAEELGLDVVDVFYPLDVDWTTLAATILDDDPDAVILGSAQEPVCIAAIQALRAAGYDGLIHAGACTQMIDQLTPEELENTIVTSQFYDRKFTEIPEKVQRDFEIFDRYIEVDESQSEYYAQFGFILGVDGATMLQQVEGDVTAASVLETLPTVQGDSFFQDTGEGYDCSAVSWPGTTACGGGFLGAQITADRQKEPIEDASPIDVSDVADAFAD